MTLQLGWFSTGKGEGSQGLLKATMDSIQRGELDAHLQFVFSNREPGEHEGSDRYFELVRRHAIPLVCYSSRQFQKNVGRISENREAYDCGIMEHLQEFSPQVIALAGYMLITSPIMCRTYPMINLHPALPNGPKGTWQEVIWNLIEHRASESGGIVHLATEHVDQGPPIAYFTFSLRSSLFDPLWQAMEADPRPIEEIRRVDGDNHPLFEAIRAEEIRREPHLLLEALKALASGLVHIESSQVVDAQGKRTEARCLNHAIENALAR